MIATMMMVHKALKAADELIKKGIDVEIIDPRTLVPLNRQGIIDSVKKTGRAVVVSEDCKTAGAAAEIASFIMEEAFDCLDAPVRRVSALDVPIPYSPVLEGIAIPRENDIVKAVKETVGCFIVVFNPGSIYIEPSGSSHKYLRCLFVDGVGLELAFGAFSLNFNFATFHKLYIIGRTFVPELGTKCKISMKCLQFAL